MTTSYSDDTTTRQVMITVTGIPTAEPQRLRGLLVMSAQSFGLDTIRAGFNRAQDMPAERDYRDAAQIVEVLLAHEDTRPISAAVLVNIIAAALSNRGAQT